MNNGIGNSECDTSSVVPQARETFGAILNHPKGLNKFRKVVIEVVRHEDQRYDTCGDWYIREGVLYVYVSEFEDARSHWAIAVHELIEALLCTNNGISDGVVDAFDLGEGADYDEPGMHPSAPYHKEHLYATSVERRLVNTLGVIWETHNESEPK
jgi:hypothetical protein